MKTNNRIFYRELVQDYELDPAVIGLMSRNEVFDHILKYEGYGNGAAYFIHNLVKTLYGIDLNHYRDYLTQDELRELEGRDEE